MSRFRSWFRRASRLVDDPASAGSPLVAAMIEYGAERADAETVARLQQRLSAAFATPSAARCENAAPAWLLRLSVAACALVLALFLQRGAPDEQTEPAPHVQRDAVTSFSAIEIAGRLGVTPRQLASQAAMDGLQLSFRSHRAP